MFTTYTTTLHSSSKMLFRSGESSVKRGAHARTRWKKSTGSLRGMSVVKANRTASDEIEMLQKMLELAKRRKENEKKEDSSVSTGEKGNGSGYEGKIKERILEAIFESNFALIINKTFSKRRAIRRSQIGFVRNSIPKDFPPKAYSKHTWLCYITALFECN